MTLEKIQQQADYVILIIDERSSLMGGLLLSLLAVGFYWSGVLRNDATPYGDGSRIMPFIRMFDHNPSWFPMWSYRNGGEPILASPEHFYLLGYLIDWSSQYSNFILNLCLFLLLIALAASAYLLGRLVSGSNLLASLYTIGVTCNGIIIEAERSARFQQLTIIILTLACAYLFLRQNKCRNWLIPIFIAIAIYNGIHYGIFPIAGIFMLAIYTREKQKIVEVIKYSIAGTILSFPFLLPVIFHPITSGAITPDKLNYTISTIGLHNLVNTFTGGDLYHFVGYQAILIFPLILVSIRKPFRKHLQFLLPIIPWIYFIVAAYSDSFKHIIEVTPLSNWRHNIIFYQNFMLFSLLFLISVTSSIKQYRIHIVYVLIITTSASYINTFSEARAEYIETTKRIALHQANGISIWQNILEDAVKPTTEANRVYLNSGLLIPEYRSFTSFSYFMSKGYWNVRSISTPGVEPAQRPHWVGDGDRGSCTDFAPVMLYAGYTHMICFPHIKDIGYGYKRINDDKWGIYENNNVRSIGLSCNPDEIISREITQSCIQNLKGNAIYHGDTIEAKLDLHNKSTIFFHENYAWGWYASVNGDIQIPRSVNDVFIGLDLEPGIYKIKLRYIDPFFIVGILISLAYILIYIVLLKRKSRNKFLNNSSLSYNHS